MNKIIPLAIIVLCCSLTLGYAQEAALKIRVEGIDTNRKGEIGVALFDNKKEYPTNFDRTVSIKWVEIDKENETVELEFGSLPAGEYAVTVIHDEDGGRILDNNAQGYPEEGVGFSNNPRIVEDIPDYKEAKFNISKGESKEITINMAYLNIDKLQRKTSEGGESTIEVSIEGIQGNQGEIGIFLFNNEKGFPLDPGHAFEGEWFSLSDGQKTLDHIYSGLPEGEYAVTVVHDEDGGRILDNNAQGYPEEGVGFSNNPRIVQDIPDYKEAKFNISKGESKEITINMAYLNIDKLQRKTSERGESTIEVNIEGIQSNQGEIGIFLYNSEEGFPLDPGHAFEGEWFPLSDGQKALDYVYSGLPEGEYAVSVFHDENGNRRLDRNKQSFPKEATGFSNGQKVVRRPPSFEKSKFLLKEKMKVAIILDYKEMLIDTKTGQVKAQKK